MSGNVSANIGNLRAGAGLDVVFVGESNKTKARSAVMERSIGGMNNWLGKYWGRFGQLFPMPSMLTLQYPTYSIVSFVLRAPVDAPIMTRPTVVQFDGWDGDSWVTLWTGNTVGTIGEVLTVVASQMVNTNRYYAHRVVISGDTSSSIAVAKLDFIAGSEAVLALPPNSEPPLDFHTPWQPAISIESAVYTVTGEHIIRVTELEIGAESYVASEDGVTLGSGLVIDIVDYAYTGHDVNSARTGPQLQVLIPIGGYGVVGHEVPLSDYAYSLSLREDGGHALREDGGLELEDQEVVE